MPAIQHVSLTNYQQGNHIPAPVVIRIADSETLFGEDKKDQQIYRFIFTDVNENQTGAITKTQAKQILDILTHAKDNNLSVLVHCIAGIARSGAVAQFAIDYLGFTDNTPTGTTRIPNLAVLNALRLAYQGQTNYEEIFGLED